MANLKGDSNRPGVAAIFGIHRNPNPGDASIVGQSNSHGRGVLGVSETGQGVWGASGSSTGVVGVSKSGTGTSGESTNVGVVGISTKTEFSDPPGIGVQGVSTASGSNGIGVLGEGGRTGVLGRSTHFDGNGVRAESGGRGAALLVDNTGDFSAALIRQFGSGSLIVCRVTQNRDVFRVLNSGEVQASGDVKARGVTLTCDRNAKANLTDVDARQVLETLAGMPIQNWNYKSDPTSVRHIGPTSQDFQAAFGLNGDDDIHISAVDAQGIALAAIQGLNEKLQAENAELRTNLASLEGRLAALESMAQRTAEPSPA
jgi:Chaperone of endosialidase